MNHISLFGRDLAGWKLTRGYILHLLHNCAGYFPAILENSADKEFICTDKSVLIDIAELLPPRNCRVRSLQILVNEELEIAFSIGRIHDGCDEDPEKNTHLVLVTRKMFDNLTAAPNKTSPFIWAPGLFSLSHEPSKEDYLLGVQESLAEMQ